MTGHRTARTGLLVIAGVRTQEDASRDLAWPVTTPTGVFDPRLLLQDEIWIDPNGMTHRLENLAPEHALHVLETLLDMELELEMAARARVSAEMATGVLDRRTGRRHLAALTALGRRWVEETPLLQRLASLHGVSFPARSETSAAGQNPSTRVTLIELAEPP